MSTTIPAPSPLHAADVSDRPRASRAYLIAGLQAAIFIGGAAASGMYELSVWGLVALGEAAVLIAVLATRLSSIARTSRLTLAALTALAAWSATSLLWAESTDRAWTETNRLLLYLMAYALGLLTMRSIRGARSVLAVIGAGLALLAVITAGRLLSGDGPSLFLEHRLNAPLDYINGTAALFAVGLWPLMGFAAQRVKPALAGAALALAVLEGNLLILTQARAVIPAVFVAFLVLVLLSPDRARTFWMFAALAMAVAMGLPWTGDVYASGVGHLQAAPTELVVQRAAMAALLTAAVAGAVWGLVVALAARPMPPGVRRLPAWGAIALVALALVGAVVTLPKWSHELHVQWTEFESLKVDTTVTSRITSGGGYRYDLWRVAYREFAAHPLVGVGAGNYDRDYFRLRHNPESVRQPHSVGLQTFAELGMVGGLLLLLFVGGVSAQIWAAAKRARTDPSQSLILVGSTGMIVSWLVVASVDWPQLLPAVTGIVVLAAAALVAPVSATASLIPRHKGGGRHAFPMLALVVLVAVAAASIGRQYEADRQQRRAAALLVRDPVGTLRASADALALNPSALSSYYTRAAAFARLGDAAAARAELERATSREPHNYVTWALLGDLAARQGHWRAARAAYAHSLRLNPGDPALPGLVANPKAAVQ